MAASSLHSETNAIKPFKIEMACTYMRKREWKRIIRINETDKLYKISLDGAARESDQRHVVM